jgi:hypothetical protein
MEHIEEAKKLLAQLETSLSNVSEWIKYKENETAKLLRERDESLRMKQELHDALEPRSVEVCQYKTEYESIKTKYNTENLKKNSRQNFHFFLSYQRKYARTSLDVIDSHERVISQHGFCWWGKFYKEQIAENRYNMLEPFGESIRIDEEGAFARSLRDRVRERVGNGDNVYLFIYNPNPPDLRLHVANVVEFYYGKEKIPYQDDYKTDLPSCAYMPDYYFLKVRGNCSACREADLQRCRLRFLSNFWFKINRIAKVDALEGTFGNLLNCFTNDSVNFAVPILYPLIVTQKKALPYFGETATPFVQPEKPCLVEIPSKERAHTKTEKVDRFFKNLNSNCGNCFVKVQSMEVIRSSRSVATLMAGGNDDEIFLCLPGGYRVDNKSMRFRIVLDKRTAADQKKRVEQLISEYLGRR